MKGQIPVLEMIAVTIILFVTFAILFPQTGFQNRWRDADPILSGRDISTTIDRIGNMEPLIANPNQLANFLSNTLPDKSLVYWVNLDGTAKSKITVACNCTTEQIGNLLDWAGRLKLNGRDIKLDVLPSSLSPIQDSDVLLIWGRTDLAPFKNDIINYLHKGNGVIGIANVVNPDSTYTQIFGVTNCLNALPAKDCSNAKTDTHVSFNVPDTASQLTYQPFKLFYHLPIRELGRYVVGTIPIENGIPSCNTYQGFQGNFSFFGYPSDTSKPDFWICDPDTLYLDTDNDQKADLVLNSGQTFSISGSSFKLSYMDFNKTFISILPGYQFNDFRDNNVNLYPADLDDNKILLSNGLYCKNKGNDENNGGCGNKNNKNPNGGRLIPVAVMNGTESGTTVWAADFFSNPVTNDRRLLIASMILSASNKKSTESLVGSITNVKRGFVTPYVNIANQDMFEVYQFSLGLGFPF